MAKHRESFKEGDSVTVVDGEGTLKFYIGKTGVIKTVFEDYWLDIKFQDDSVVTCGLTDEWKDRVEREKINDNDVDVSNRKDMPVFSGVLKYFPDALMELSKVSKAGNDQHNPGKKMFWDRSKSGDEQDALTRHLIDDARDPGGVDSDGVLHLAKVAWRALAALQKYKEVNK